MEKVLQLVSFGAGNSRQKEAQTRSESHKAEKGRCNKHRQGKKIFALQPDWTMISAPIQNTETQKLLFFCFTTQQLHFERLRKDRGWNVITRHGCLAITHTYFDISSHAQRTQKELTDDA